MGPLARFLALFKLPDLRKKVLVIIALLAVYRLAAHIPVPGVEIDALRQFFQGNQLLGLLDIFAGGGLSNLSIVMLGVAPYITASIVFQLLTMIVPRLEEMQKEEGEAGRRKIQTYTRLLTVPLAAIQGFGFLTLLSRGTAGGAVPLQFAPMQFMLAILTVTAGTVFLMWIGELISERGLGNGASLIIFLGIVAQAPQGLRQVFVLWDPSKLPIILAFLAVALVVTAGVVFVTEAQRNIPVTYAKRVRGGRLLGGAATHLPLRVNQAGVIPIIFALSLLLFPGVIAQFFVASKNEVVARIAQGVVGLFNTNWIYGIFYFLLVVIFTYFYTAIIFDPKKIAEHLQKQGGFVPGIRPGPMTASFLKRIVNRITVAGAIFLGAIAVLPLGLQGFTRSPALTIGGTGLLIVVSVILETMKQIDAQLTMREYETT
ncbi:MAG: preprotein translocase subunit SecY [Parcubacteria group bacterium Gr01-1014_38]|nr:MAG: preprotein translocase subunit SecY [Parcubacteria group bacterium Gr01-1014_38]